MSIEIRDGKAYEPSQELSLDDLNRILANKEAEKIAIQVAIDDIEAAIAIISG